MILTYKTRDELEAEIKSLKDRVCRNCKHYDGGYACLNEDSIAYKTENRVYDTDGCIAEFEPRTK